jgi:hypothetical protein
VRAASSAGEWKALTGRSGVPERATSSLALLLPATLEVLEMAPL